jgi:hypothetical protein
MCPIREDVVVFFKQRERERQIRRTRSQHPTRNIERVREKQSKPPPPKIGRTQPSSNIQRVFVSSSSWPVEEKNLPCRHQRCSRTSVFFVWGALAFVLLCPTCPPLPNVSLLMDVCRWFHTRSWVVQSIIGGQQTKPTNNPSSADGGGGFFFDLARAVWIGRGTHRISV